MARSIQAALLSRDASLISLLQQAATQLQIELLEIDDGMRYIDLVSQEPFDVLVLDCRGSPAAKHFVATVREASANREAIFMIAADPEGESPPSTLGKHVLLTPPFSVTQMEEHLRAALPIIHERHRNYDRLPVGVEVQIICEEKNWGLDAISLNLSEGGIAVQLPQRIHLELEEAVRISFELPEHGGKIEASAVLAWMNNDLHAGFRFKPLTPSNSAKLSTWLNQHAAPEPGVARKQIVESWLAQHGKESGTVIIGAGMRDQIFAKPKLEPAVATAQPEASLEHEALPAVAPKRKLNWRTIIIFAIGIALGLLMSRLLRLF
jgi:DNA-binding response OmpR family regulator